MSRLIDADELELDTKWDDYCDEFTAYSESQIDCAEEVKAIPLDRVKQAREEMISKKNTVSLMFEAECYNNGVSQCLEILDKLIAESEG